MIAFRLMKSSIYKENRIILFFSRLGCLAAEKYVIHMNLSRFYIEQGEVNLNEKFISLRIVKEALEKSFRISVLDESSKHLSCKMIRWARLYGAPSIFPHPNLELNFVDENNMTIIRYSYKYYDFIYALLCALIFFILGPLVFDTSTL